MANIVYPTLTGWVRTGEHPTFLNSAEPWDADDPFVHAHPDLFSADPGFAPRRSVPAGVEQASAAPGEKRATRRSRSADSGDSSAS